MTRLKRAQGQLAVAIRMLEECEDVVMQLSAVSKAIDRAGYPVMSASMRKYFSEEWAGSIDEKKLEKMFLALA